MEKWTPTKLNDAKGCYRKYVKKWISKAPAEVEIPEFHRGIEIHNKIEQYLQIKNENILYSFANPALIEAIKKLANEPVKIEVMLQNENLEGIADIVIDYPDKWTVIDIKSRYDNELDENIKLQLYFYLYLLQKIQEKSDAEIGMIAVFNHYDPLVIKKAKLIKVDELKSYIEHEIETAERKLKHKRISISSCRYCEYVLSCDVIPEKPQDIETVARKYMQTKMLLQYYENQLREYVETTGQNVTVDEVEIGLHTKNMTTVDTSVLCQIADRYGIDILSLLKPSITAIKKTAKKYPEVLNACFIEQTKEFGARKIKENV